MAKKKVVEVEKEKSVEDNVPAEISVESSSPKPEYESHPKFAKFKKLEEQQHEHE